VGGVGFPSIGMLKLCGLFKTEFLLLNFSLYKLTNYHELHRNIHTTGKFPAVTMFFFSLHCTSVVTQLCLVPHFVFLGPVHILCLNMASTRNKDRRGCEIFSIILLLPLALQPVVGFGLSNNTSPFVPIYHELSPSSHS
jgi:hypothetical protein